MDKKELAERFSKTVEEGVEEIRRSAEENEKNRAIARNVRDTVTRERYALHRIKSVLNRVGSQLEVEEIVDHGGVGDEVLTTTKSNPIYLGQLPIKDGEQPVFGYARVFVRERRPYRGVMRRIIQGKVDSVVDQFGIEFTAGYHEGADHHKVDTSTVSEYDEHRELEDVRDDTRLLRNLPTTLMTDYVRDFCRETVVGMESSLDIIEPEVPQPDATFPQSQVHQGS